MKFRYLICLFLLFSLIFVSGITVSAAGENLSLNDNPQLQERELVFGAHSVAAASLDPRKPTGGLGVGRDLLFNALVRIDKNMNPQPGIATWETPDDRTYIFHIKEGITFSNGDELTAEDVKYTFESILDPEFGAPNRENYSLIESIEVIDNHTIQFTLEEPYGPIIQYLSNSYTGIVPKNYIESLEDPEEFSYQPIGSGPYVLEEWNPGENMKLRARPDYWEGPVNIETVTIRANPEDSVRLMQLRSGDVHIADRIPLGEIESLQEDERFNIITTPPPGFEFIGFNLNQEPFDNHKVRQAFSYAVDRQAIAEFIFFGFTEPAYGPIPPSLWAYNPEVEDVYSYNPEKAKELLAEAGYEEGLSVTLQFSGRWQEPQYTQVVQQQLAEIGVEVELVQREWGSHLDDLFNRNFGDMYVLAWTPVWDPDQVMFRSFSTDNDFNWGGYSNPRVDELLVKGRNTLDLDERREIYQEAQLLVVKDAPYLFLHLNPYHLAISDDLENFDVGPSSYGIFDAMINIRWKEN